jgi:hypothetical protein
VPFLAVKELCTQPHFSCYSYHGFLVRLIVRKSLIFNQFHPTALHDKFPYINVAEAAEEFEVFDDKHCAIQTGAYGVGPQDM